MTRARIPYPALLACIELYKAGYSTGFIAERVWEKFGYKDAENCQAALCLAFRKRKIPMRQTCSSCGTRIERRTPGCGSCRTRHAFRKMRGLSYRAPVCCGCGGDYESLTDGCRACVKRHEKREERKRALAAVDTPLLVLADNGEGTTLTERKAA